MFKIALVLFALAALGGIVLAGFHLKTKDAPIPLALLHGLLAASGLVLFIVGIVQGVSSGALVTSLVLYLVAAIGGFVLLAMHLKRPPISVPLLGVHAAAAVVATVLLWNSLTA